MQQLAWTVERGTIFRLLQEDMSYFLLTEQGSQITFEPIPDVVGFLAANQVISYSFAFQSPQFRIDGGYDALQRKIDKNIQRWRCPACDYEIEKQYLTFRIMAIGNQGGVGYKRKDLSDIVLVEKINEVRMICPSCGKDLPIEYFGLVEGGS